MKITLRNRNKLERRQKPSPYVCFVTLYALLSLGATVLLSLVSKQHDVTRNEYGTTDVRNNFFAAVEAFTISPTSVVRHDHRRHFVDSLSPRGRKAAGLLSLPTDGENRDTAAATMDATAPLDCATVVRAPLKFIGPYPCLALKFPNLSTESQRSRNLTGISLDFVLDTAANINTLQAQVAQELSLPLDEDSPALPGVSSSGPMAGGETFVLGDSQLEEAATMIISVDGDQDQDLGLQDEPFDFMQNLTAAALPVVNPGNAGLLGLAFFYCFEGGVEFCWGSSQQQDQQQRLVDGIMVPTNFQDDSSPSVTFYGEDDSNAEDGDSLLQRALSDLVRVSIDPIPLTQLPSLKIKINGVEMMALLDTGSPITVLNQGAARAAGIQTSQDSMEASNEAKTSTGGWKNPFSSVMDKVKEAQATAEAASRGEILMIGGSDGRPTTLYRSSAGSHPSISVDAIEDGEFVSFGDDLPVYVGDIPGLAALNGIGVDSPPAVVLGLDVLRRRPRMLFRPRENEVYF